MSWVYYPPPPVDRYLHRPPFQEELGLLATTVSSCGSIVATLDGDIVIFTVGSPGSRRNIMIEIELSI